MCGSRLGSVSGARTETMQKIKNILKSLAAVINKNKLNAADNSGKVVHAPLCFKQHELLASFCLLMTVHR